MSTFLGGSDIIGMYLGSNEISEMYLGSNLIYSSWPYKTLRISKDGGVTWEDYGRPVSVSPEQFESMGVTHVELPYSLTTIGISAFKDNNLTSVELPDSLASIRVSAFENNNLTSVELPDAMSSVQNSAFRNNQLTSVKLPKNLKFMNGYAFMDNNLTSIDIPDSNYQISSYVFANNKLRTVNLPKGLTRLYSYAFYNNQLTSVEIPDSLTSIGNGAFMYNQLTSVIIPDSVTNIGGSAFRNNQLTSVVIPDSVTNIEGSAFRNNQLTSVEIPDSVTDIGEYAFRDNPNLDEVRISGQTTYVESGTNATFDSHTNIITYSPDIIMGVEWDKQADPTLTRIGESKDFVANIGIGDEVVRNDFNRAPIYREMKRVTDDLGNVFVKIPKFYIRKTDDTDLFRLEISKEKFEGSYLPCVFWDFENNKELDYFYYGAYQASLSTDGTKLESKSGVYPKSSVRIFHFRNYSENIGPGYQLLDIHAIDVIQSLFYVEFATLNSQSIHPGYTGGTRSAYTGGTDGVVASSGASGYDGTYQFMYRGIEDLWGNLAQWVDGINISSRWVYVCEDATKYTSDSTRSPYQILSYRPYDTGGYVKELGFDPDRPYAQFPVAAGVDTGATEDTYYSDRYNYSGLSGNRVAHFGGRWSTGLGAGISNWDLAQTSQSLYSWVGGRLLYKPL